MAIRFENCAIECKECETEMFDSPGHGQQPRGLIFEFRQRFFGRAQVRNDQKKSAKSKPSAPPQLESARLPILDSLGVPSNTVESALLALLASKFLRRALRGVHANASLARRRFGVCPVPRFVADLAALAAKLFDAEGGAPPLAALRAGLALKDPVAVGYAAPRLVDAMEAVVEVMERKVPAIASRAFEARVVDEWVCESCDGSEQKTRKVMLLRLRGGSNSSLGEKVKAALAEGGTSVRCICCGGKQRRVGKGKVVKLPGTLLLLVEGEVVLEKKVEIDWEVPGGGVFELSFIARREPRPGPPRFGLTLRRHGEWWELRDGTQSRLKDFASVASGAKPSLLALSRISTPSPAQHNVASLTRALPCLGGSVPLVTLGGSWVSGFLKEGGQSTGTPPLCEHGHLAPGHDDVFRRPAPVEARGAAGPEDPRQNSEMRRVDRPMSMAGLEFLCWGEELPLCVAEELAPGPRPKLERCEPCSRGAVNAMVRRTIEKALVLSLLRRGGGDAESFLIERSWMSSFGRHLLSDSSPLRPYWSPTTLSPFRLPLNSNASTSLLQLPHLPSSFCRVSEAAFAGLARLFEGVCAVKEGPDGPRLLRVLPPWQESPLSFDQRRLIAALIDWDPRVQPTDTQLSGLLQINKKLNHLFLLSPHEFPDALTSDIPPLTSGAKLKAMAKAFELFGRRDPSPSNFQVESETLQLIPSELLFPPPPPPFTPKTLNSPITPRTPLPPFKHLQTPQPSFSSVPPKSPRSPRSPRPKPLNSQLLNPSTPQHLNPSTPQPLYPSNFLTPLLVQKTKSINLPEPPPPPTSSNHNESLTQLSLDSSLVNIPRLSLDDPPPRTSSPPIRPSFNLGKENFPLL